MKRKLFKKVLLTLTMLFGLSGVVNAQVDPKVEAQVKEQSAKELKLIKDYLKLEDTGLEKLEEILVDKNWFLQYNELDKGRNKYVVRNTFLRYVEKFFKQNLGQDKFTLLIGNKELLDKISLNVEQ